MSYDINKTQGIFVNENGCIRYADLIAGGYKKVETRSRNMLADLVGRRVAIVRTRRHKAPLIVGYATIASSTFCRAEDFQKYFDLHLVRPGTAYDCKGRGKWFYWMEDAQRCKPVPLPDDAVRHGRSWCEF